MMKMTFSDEDKVLIKWLWESKKYDAKRLLKMFPNWQWNLSGLQKLIRKIDEIGGADRRLGSGRLCTACSTMKIEEVQELALSQEGKPQSHSTQRQIAWQSSISSASVNAVIRKDLRLICFKKSKPQQLTSDNKLAHLNRYQQLLRRYPVSMINFIWFTGRLSIGKHIFLFSRKHLIKTLKTNRQLVNMNKASKSVCICVCRSCVWIKSCGHLNSDWVMVWLLLLRCLL